MNEYVIERIITVLLIKDMVLAKFAIANHNSNNYRS